MATVQQLVERLTINLGIQPSEQIGNELLADWVVDAILRHNANYSSDGSNLPNREVQLVLLLAQVSVCLYRASKWADQNSLSGGQGYGQDRNDPFHKHKELARSFLSQYKEACADMGISPNSDIEAGNTLVSGIITSTDSELSIRTPYERDPTVLKKPTLTVSGITSSSFVLSWTPSRDLLFTDYFVFFYQGEQELFQSWNYEGSVYPQISDNATKLLNYTVPDRSSVKIVDLAANTKYSVILVVLNSNGKRVYSDTKVVTTAA